MSDKRQSDTSAILLNRLYKGKYNCASLLRVLKNICCTLTAHFTQRLIESLTFIKVLFKYISVWS